MASLDSVSSSSPIRYVVNTHDDGDHFSLNHLFRRKGAIVLASEVCRASIHEKMNEKVWVDHIRKYNPELGRDIENPAELVPQIGIERRATIVLGGERIELVSMGHGHSRGDLVIHLPERRLLFAGDLVFAGAHGRCKTTDFGGLLKILDALAELECDTVVPGHGVPLVGGGTEPIATYRDYLVTLQQRVAELADSGVGIEEAKTRFGDWKYANWGRPELLPTAVEHAYKDYVWRSRFYKFQALHEDAKK
jgi:glyoxylase-like metal-dependent hydrolase (beta-lactamase superfamily II)